MHKITEGSRTGYGSSRRLAEDALEEAKSTGRKYVQYTVDPKDESYITPWNHYGPHDDDD